MLSAVYFLTHPHPHPPTSKIDFFPIGLFKISPDNMKCDICHCELSIRDPVVIYRDGRYRCISCPTSHTDYKKELIQNAYDEFCKVLQKHCENTPELNTALEQAFLAKEAALIAALMTV